MAMDEVRTKVVDIIANQLGVDKERLPPGPMLSMTWVRIRWISLSW